MMTAVTASSGELSGIAKATSSFFAEHAVASLRLPSGWFGRPHDNLHQLTEASTEDGVVLVRLDDKQLLTLKADPTVRGGRLDWTDYGGDQEHSEVLGPGDVEFRAPFHR
jgi:hypothetical protein